MDASQTIVAITKEVDRLCTHPAGKQPRSTKNFSTSSKMVAQKLTWVTPLSGSDDLPCTNSVQTKNWTKMPKILPQRHYGSQTAFDTLKTMMKRKRITSSQKLWNRFNKQGLKNQSLEEPPNKNVVDSTREVTLTVALDAEDVLMETKKFFYSREEKEDTGLLVVPRTISVASASVFNMVNALRASLYFSYV